MPGRMWSAREVWGLAASEVVLLSPHLLSQSRLAAGGGEVYLISPCCRISGQVSQEWTAWPEGSGAAGRRPGRRWGPPTTFADGWARKKKRRRQFGYRNMSSAGTGILFPSLSLIHVIAHSFSLWCIQFWILLFC